MAIFKDMTVSETFPTPLVSVVIPVKNGEETIGDTLFSVISQNLKHPFEIIVVDDGSTDNTADEAELYAQLDESIPLKVIRHLKNRGVSAARNTGIKAARGKFIAFVDADDIWVMNKLERQLDTVQKLSEEDQERVFCMTYFRFLNPGNRISYSTPQINIQTDKKTGKETISPTEFDARDIEYMIITMQQWFFASGSLFAHRKALEKIGGYNERLTCFEDSEVIFRHLLNNGLTIVVPEFLAYYRIPEIPKDYRLKNEEWDILLNLVKPIEAHYGAGIADIYRRRVGIHRLFKSSEPMPWCKTAQEVVSVLFNHPSDLIFTAKDSIQVKKGLRAVRQNLEGFAHFYPF